MWMLAKGDVPGWLLYMSVDSCAPLRVCAANCLCLIICSLRALSLLYIGPNLFLPPLILSARTAAIKQGQSCITAFCEKEIIICQGQSRWHKEPTRTIRQTQKTKENYIVRQKHTHMVLERCCHFYTPQNQKIKTHNYTSYSIPNILLQSKHFVDFELAKCSIISSNSQNSTT